MLSLISGRDQVVKLTPEQGEGWKNCLLNDNPYLFATLKVAGWVEVTVTAFDCDGVRIIDWDRSANTNYDGVVSRKCSSVTAVLNRTGFGPVVRVNNPTESTEVYMSYRRLSPPPPVV